jgi:hypothetical protein
VERRGLGGDESPRVVDEGVQGVLQHVGDGVLLMEMNLQGLVVVTCLVQSRDLVA